MEMFFTHDDGNLEMYLRDENDALFSFAQSRDDNETLVYTNNTGADRTIYMQPYGNGQNNTYTFEFSDDCDLMDQ